MAKTGTVVRKVKMYVEKQVEQKTDHSSVASSVSNQSEEQQMNQREDDKATREQELLIESMEHDSSKRAREEREVQQE
eukprot:4633416-Ditylum_brightwellii.AAC.1